MSKFKKFLLENNFSFNYESDPFWQDVWYDLLDYYNGSQQSVNQAINDSIEKHNNPQEAKNKLLKMLASIKANGATQRGVGIPEV